ncbi:TPA: N-6 DNA methylase [Vibrio parahaemolyticus]|uniref:class I SAM-dependent DNA methyltransferase n=1 Tax=Vibrio parahaemolyticus TaxID=670 RepID=UPI0003FD4C5A|nr:N-6 DNA methylase [Vibrio parahaemolyticus]KON59159.1 SAM-dependent methyltransferase [Vibrio parahaemolyticus]KZW06815.1 SAM-dependent methyltransferase [Vibrio parahaemolyticus]KZW08184.1 SAM-dependent methyltransferase [Vibrio parahaemolyticus]KZW11525.1 SAM-dependent methyltransferase [Vibrio parahaemolyticus]KZW20114.1 SAM-dependent methyltransferase [Vibrio parahaemolyticus]
MSTQDLVAKLWNLCNLLRDDGVTYHEYLNELTYLIFLKMVEETGQDELLPEGYRWEDLEAYNAATRLEQYQKLLAHLGYHGSLITKAIFKNASTVIRKPATLNKLVVEIDKLDWYSAKTEGLGDMYEGLLEINAGEKKSGAGQYFTPRVLIDVMVELMKPTLDDVIVDPTAGTGGFLISAHNYLEQHNDIQELEPELYSRYQHKTFFGMELVQDTHRLGMMNLMLHDLAVDDQNSGILFGDTLSNEGKALPPASLILANPPFGTKQGGGVPTRDDLVHYTSNKQLAFLHLMYHKMLKPGGRAAVVLPDNVLFEGSTGQTIRKDLMEKCNLHTILRLPTGIFYAAGVKTNVLFFSKPEDVTQDKGQTQNVWVYDLRSNMPKFGKRTVLTKKHFDEFYEAVGSDLTQVDEKARQNFLSKHKDDIDGCRLRCFSRNEIKTKDESLDLSWIRDENNEDASKLPAPDVLINEALIEMAGAMEELKAILADLDATESEEVAL